MGLKKLLSGVLATVLCSALMVTPISAEDYSQQLGDVNYDGYINNLDVISIKKMIMGIEPVSLVGDINGDGRVNILDINIINNNIIDNIVNPSIVEEIPQKTICLDAGHYGLYNRSPGVPAYYESNMTWKLHLYLKQELESYGFNVITTRESQAIDRGLISRGRASEGCDLFLSIHSNAVGSYMSSTDYPVAIVLTPDDSTNIDEISKDIGVRLADTVADTMQTKQQGRTIYKVATYDVNGDGVLNDNWYGVLAGARSVETPGILMEHSFHTNARAANWLLDENNLQTLAKAEAKTLAEYFGLA